MKTSHWFWKAAKQGKITPWESNTYGQQECLLTGLVGELWTTASIQKTKKTRYGKSRGGTILAGGEGGHHSTHTKKKTARKHLQAWRKALKRKVAWERKKEKNQMAGGSGKFDNEGKRENLWQKIKREKENKRRERKFRKSGQQDSGGGGIFSKNQEPAKDAN